MHHGRPLRIAIDEPSWRLNNLTEAQVYAIQVKSDEPAYRGIEKNIFYRLAKLLQKNIQPLFVFDGLGKPWKKGKVSGRPDDYWEKIRGVREFLDVLKIPHHVAPGEAEAECARLQQEGVVDAVWSEDADALMFGAGVVIRDHRIAKNKKDEGLINGDKANSKKSGDSVRVYRMVDIQRTLDLDREALICFVLLNGGDYDPVGLRGCGQKQAMAAARSGLGRNLCCFRTDFELAAWRLQVAEFFRGKFAIPPDFARSLHVKNYCHPKVSSPEQLRNLRCLQRGWDMPLDEAKVRNFISTRFNMWTKSYMDWIGPILLVRSLLSTTPDLSSNKYDIKLTRRKKKHTDLDSVEDVNCPYTEVKLTYLARSVTSLDYNKIDDGHWLGKMGIPHDDEYRTECEILYCFLRGFVPEEIFETLEPNQSVSKKASKRKANEDVVELDEAGPSTSKPVKKRRSTTREQAHPPEQLRKRGRPSKKAGSTDQVHQTPSVPIDPPKAVFRLPTSLAALREISWQEDDDDDLVFVGQRTLLSA